MNNNDVFRRLQYALNRNNPALIECFVAADASMDNATLSSWLRHEDEPGYQEMPDEQLAIFLNGLINVKRGKREGKQLPPEKRLNNNLIFRKLRIALNYTDTDILQVMQLADFRMSKHELSAFFRKPTQNQYRQCLDQVLRRFLHGLQLKLRANVEVAPLPEAPKRKELVNIKPSPLKERAD